MRALLFRSLHSAPGAFVLIAVGLLDTMTL